MWVGARFYSSLKRWFLKRGSRKTTERNIIFVFLLLAGRKQILLNSLGILVYLVEWYFFFLMPPHVHTNFRGPSS